MSKPKIVVVLDGGLVQNVYLNDGEPADVLVIDLDTDGADEVHLFEDPDADDFGGEIEACAHFESSTESDLGETFFKKAIESGVNDLREDESEASLSSETP